MKGSYLCYMVGVTSLLLGISVLTNPATGYVTSFPDEPDIDGKLMTVGIAIAKYLAGLIPYPGVSTLIIAIIDAWTPKPEDNYWENIKDNVAEMCGEFINDHNLKQVEVYKGDLMGLLERYERAPIIGDGTYPDKNMMANSLSTSIIANRFLIEAAEMPWSMSIDFADVSNVHVLILKDAAETYSSPGEVSRWWHDLSTELKHYIDYGVYLQNVTKEWRDSQIECNIQKATQACLDFRWMGVTCYDVFEIRDHVTGHQEKCSQVHPDTPDQGSCVNFCKNYQTHTDRSSQEWFYHNVGSVVDEMESLKVKADEMAKHVSQYYNIYTKEQEELAKVAVTVPQVRELWNATTTVSPSPSVTDISALLIWCLTLLGLAILMVSILVMYYFAPFPFREILVKLKIKGYIMLNLYKGGPALEYSEYQVLFK